MIGISFNGKSLDKDLTAAIDSYASKIKGEVLISGAAAMARVVYEEVLRNTSGASATGAPGSPPKKKTGTLHSAVYRVYSPEKSGDDRKVYRVSVNKSKAPHWALVEFGTSRSPAYPYLRPAADRIPEAVEEGRRRMEERVKEIGG